MGAKFSRSRGATPPTPPQPPHSTVETALSDATPTLILPSGVPIVLGTEVETEPKMKHTAESKASELPQLDLVFTMDCTGSMGSYIQAAKRNIEAIVAKLVQSEGYDLRFALIAYRDHPPQDNSYVTKKFEFTSDVQQMKSDLAKLSAQGGGDGPEAVAAGLKQTLDSNWRPNATKVCVLIADAPPHGLGESGDGFPNGAPDGVDPFEVLTQMSMKGICIYSVGCEPALSGYQYAKDFFVAAAQKTNGQAVSLRSAAALADVIMGGAIEEMDLQQLADEVVEEVRQMRAARSTIAAGDPEGYDSDEERSVAWKAIESRGHTTRHMKTKKLKSKVAGAVCKASSLSEARETLMRASPPAAASMTAFRACAIADAPRHSELVRACEAPRGARMAARMMMTERAPARSERRSSDDDEASVEASSYLGECVDEVSASGASCMSHGMSDRMSDGGSASDSDDDEGGARAPKGGVQLETRALSFSQMKRIYGRQKKMGIL